MALEAQRQTAAFLFWPCIVLKWLNSPISQPIENPDMETTREAEAEEEARSTGGEDEDEYEDVAVGVNEDEARRELRDIQALVAGLLLQPQHGPCPRPCRTAKLARMLLQLVQALSENQYATANPVPTPGASTSVTPATSPALHSASWSERSKHEREKSYCDA